jgi:sugar lactone lactonase YvrE
VITAYAGTGEARTPEATDPLEAQFGTARGLARTPTGQMYIADTATNRIMHVDTNGETTTFAGDGAPATWGGDGGAALDASFASAKGAAVDSKGTTYVVEEQRVRAIGRDGTVRTFAGSGKVGSGGDFGLATAAPLDTPGSVVVDSEDNVYFTEMANHVLRKVGADGMITTVAGNGSPGFSGDGGAATSAQLSAPLGLAIDENDNIYVADLGNNRVRKIAPGGTITTVAGNGTPGFSGDSGAATSAQLHQPIDVTWDRGTDALYIADVSNHRVRKVVVGTITTVAGNGSIGNTGDGGPATSATLPPLFGVSANHVNGSVYISGTNRLRELKANGDIDAFAGDAGDAAGFGGDGGSYRDPSVRFDLIGKPLVTTWGTTDGDLASVIVPDQGNNRLRLIALDADLITTIAGTGDLATWGGDGGAATDAQLSGPTGLALDGDGDIVFSDTGSHRIRKIDTASGIITTIAGDGTPCSGFCVDGNAPLRSQFETPLGLAIASIDIPGVFTGDVIFVADAEAHVVRVVYDELEVGTLAGTGMAGFSGDGSDAVAAELNFPYAVALADADYGDPNWKLAIADAQNNRVRVVDADTKINTVAGDGSAANTGDGGAATAAGVVAPISVAYNADGDLFVGGWLGAPSIRRVDHATGHISTVAGGSDPGFAGDKGGAPGGRLVTPAALAVDALGDLFFVDGGHIGGDEYLGAGRVRRVRHP